MDVHRSRFVPYPSFPITAAAFSRTSDDGLPTGLPSPTLKLAIGRQNGEIEIWDPVQGQWVQEVVFSGESRSIDGLAWTREPDETDTEGRVLFGQHRLFSIASSPTVTEWDLGCGQPKKQSTGNFSEVWCFAAQPRQAHTQAGEEEEARSQELVAGCGDGTIVLLTTAENDLQFKRLLARVPGKRAKCVSIAYQNRHRVLAGFMDSTIRVLDTRNGSTVRTMSLGVGIPGAPQNAIVWQIRALRNGDIVSGDSNGELVVWDGRSYTLSQRIKGHDSECLDVVVSADGQTIFSGSNDGRLAVYRLTTNPGGRKSWAKSHHRRAHDGQVKAMSAFDGTKLSVVISGGDDLVPMATPLREYSKENIRSLPTLPHSSPVASARHARLLASWWHKSITIWRIARRSTFDSSPETKAPRKLVAKLELDISDSLTSVAVSGDGRLLAASSRSDVKIFQLRRRLGDAQDSLAIRKIDVPKTLTSSGARILQFSPDSKWLVAVSRENEVQVVRFAAVPSKPKYLQVLNRVVELERQNRRHLSQSGFQEYERTVNKVDFASDSTVLVAGDLSGYLDSWVLHGHEDPTAPLLDVAKDVSKHDSSDDSSETSSDEEDTVSVFYGQHWTDNPAAPLLPQLDSAALVLSFRPSLRGGAQGNGHADPHPHSPSHGTHHRLWVMTARHQMYEFDVLAGRRTDWSRNNPRSVLPEDFTKLHDRAKGAVWDVTRQHQRLWLYGSTWMFMFNVGIDLAAAAALPTPKRKADARQPHQHPVDAKRRKKPISASTSGAGGKKIASHRDGLPETVTRFANGAWTAVSLDKPGQHGHDEDEDEDDDDGDDEGAAEEDLRLLRLRHADDSQPPQQQLSRHPTQASIPQQQLQQQQRRWWCTFKYRPILGIVPLEDDAAVAGDNDMPPPPLEVVVVERPLWDLREANK